MASVTLFDKAVYAGIDANTVTHGPRPGMAAPVSGVEWQVLTDSGMRMSCTSFGALIKGHHPKMPIVGVSYNGQPWRQYAGFRRELDRGRQPEVAFTGAGWLSEPNDQAGE